MLVHVHQPEHVGTAKGEGKVLDRPRHREARVRVLVLGLEVVHGGGACGTWWWVNPTCCGFVVPHSWRVWQPAYRPIHPAEAVPPEPTPKTTPLSPQPRSPSLHLLVEGVLGSSGLVLGERGSLVRAGRAPTSPAARAHCKVPLVWMGGGEPLAASGLEVQRGGMLPTATLSTHRPQRPPHPVHTHTLPLTL